MEQDKNNGSAASTASVDLHCAFVGSFGESQRQGQLDGSVVRLFPLARATGVGQDGPPRLLRDGMADSRNLTGVECYLLDRSRATVMSKTRSRTPVFPTFLAFLFFLGFFLTCL